MLLALLMLMFSAALRLRRCIVLLTALPDMPEVTIQTQPIFQHLPQTCGRIDQATQTDNLHGIDRATQMGSLDDDAPPPPPDSDRPWGGRGRGRRHEFLRQCGGRGAGRRPVAATANVPQPPPELQPTRQQQGQQQHQQQGQVGVQQMLQQQQLQQQQQQGPGWGAADAATARAPPAAAPAGAPSDVDIADRAETLSTIKQLLLRCRKEELLAHPTLDDTTAAEGRDSQHHQRAFWAARTRAAT